MGDRLGIPGVLGFSNFCFSFQFVYMYSAFDHNFNYQEIYFKEAFVTWISNKFDCKYFRINFFYVYIHYLNAQLNRNIC